MGLKYLLDTNICIYILKDSSENVVNCFNEKISGEVGISSIVYGELLFGAFKSDRQEKVICHLNEFLAMVPPYLLPIEAAGYYGRTRAFLEKQGKPISGNDLWIAAHAMSLNVTLVTNNEKEFKRVPGLKYENWC